MKRAIHIVCIGFLAGVVFTLGATWLNMHPRCLGEWALLAGPAVAVIAQVVALELSIRCEFPKIPDFDGKLTVCGWWAVGLCATLALGYFGRFLACASWCR